MNVAAALRRSRHVCIHPDKLHFLRSRHENISNFKRTALLAQDYHTHTISQGPDQSLSIAIAPRHSFAKVEPAQHIQNDKICPHLQSSRGPLSSNMHQSAAVFEEY